MACALATWVWIQNLKGMLLAQRRTYAAETARARSNVGPMSQLQTNVLNFLKHAGIGTR